MSSTQAQGGGRSSQSNCSPVARKMLGMLAARPSRPAPRPARQAAGRSSEEACLPWDSAQQAGDGGIGDGRGWWQQRTKSVADISERLGWFALDVGSSGLRAAVRPRPGSTSRTTHGGTFQVKTENTGAPIPPPLRRPQWLPRATAPIRCVPTISRRPSACHPTCRPTPPRPHRRRRRHALPNQASAAMHATSCPTWTTTSTFPRARPA